MKTKYCPHCNKQVPYVGKIIQRYDDRANTIYRYYCAECNRLIEEEFIFNEKSDDFEFADIHI